MHPPNFDGLARFQSSSLHLIWLHRQIGPLMQRPLIFSLPNFFPWTSGNRPMLKSFEQNLVTNCTPSRQYSVKERNLSKYIGHYRKHFTRRPSHKFQLHSKYHKTKCLTGTGIFRAQTFKKHKERSSEFAKITLCKSLKKLKICERFTFSPRHKIKIYPRHL